MATVNLGRIKPVFRGAYNNSTSYVVDDIVTSGNETFIAIQAGSGNATSNASYWTKLAAKGADGSNGSNGTDVGTVITTQGDMLYRDGSGLQRLAKGTASQELRMNSGATAPEWFTPAAASSDFVKLADVNGAGSATLSLTNILSTTYDTYKIILTYRQNDKVKFNWQFNNASGNYTSSSHYYVRFVAGGENGSSSRGSGSGWGSGEFTSDEFAQASSTRPTIMTVTLFKPADSNNNKFVKIEQIGFNDSQYIYSIVAGEVATTTAFTGFQVTTSTGNGFDATSNITAYGIKG